MSHITDEFWTTLPCRNKERRTFKTSRQRDMWERLHSKKCEICRNTITVHTGMDTMEHSRSETHIYRNGNDRIDQILVASRLLFGN